MGKLRSLPPSLTDCVPYYDFIGKLTWAMPSTLALLFTACGQPEKRYLMIE
ncbi:hypothetical protein SAMN04487965_0677 [Microbulbifer donghaiensis]|uniref:Uncharacterized protein n=1 Tax=Microbulbifer donghaiensis TaxID=494016 RepID=A0A1M4WFH5_9GAMM|nr:hypothetical protein SAMN04487965_0677 [Microbulbifer donghaiensis]